MLGVIFLLTEARVSASYVTKKKQLRAVKKKDNTPRDSWVIRGISFEINAGEAVRLIGKKESGRSSLMRIIAGLSSPTTGQLKRIGEVVFLSGENHLNPKLSGRDNILLQCLLYGSTKKEAENLVEKIIDFAGASNYIDKPVASYPCSLTTKLKLSIVIHQAADIFAIDGNLFNIDKSFAKAFSQKITELKAEKKIIFISGSRLIPIKDPFDKAFWIENGEIKSSGLPQEIEIAFQEDSTNYKLLSKQDRLAYEKSQKKDRENFKINEYYERVLLDTSTPNSSDIKQFFQPSVPLSNRIPLFYKLFIILLVLCFIFIMLNYLPTRSPVEIISEFFL